MNIDFEQLLSIYLTGVEGVLKVVLIVLFAFWLIWLFSTISQIRRYGHAYEGPEPSPSRGLIFCAVIAGICLLWPLEVLLLIAIIIGIVVVDIDRRRAHPHFKPSYYGL
jgi:hypothetical protein